MYTRDPSGVVQKKLGGQGLPGVGEAGLSSTERVIMGLPAESVEEKRAFEFFLEQIKEIGRARERTEREAGMEKRLYGGIEARKKATEEIHDRDMKTDERVRRAMVMGEMTDADKAYAEKFWPQRFEAEKFLHGILGSVPSYMMETDPDKKLQMLEDKKKAMLGIITKPEEVTDQGLLVKKPEDLIKLGDPTEEVGQMKQFKKSGRRFISDGKNWRETEPAKKESSWWEKLK
jgi:hypothetical protein